VFVGGAVFAYHQLLVQHLESRRSQAEAAFTSATQQLGAPTLALQAAGARSVFELAFTSEVPEPPATWYGPFLYTWNYVQDKREYPYLTRSLLLLKEVAATPKGDTVPEDNFLASALMLVASELRERTPVAGGLPVSTEGDLLFTADLRNARVRSVDLSGRVFGAADLSGSILDGCNLTGANLNGSHLVNSSLNGATLARVALRQADLTHSQLQFAVLEGSQLEKATLKGANLTRARAAHADFSQAVLQDSIFRGADLSGAILDGADLRAANFDQASIANASFRGADLSGADFRYSTGLEKVNSWKDAIINSTLFPPGFNPGLTAEAP